MASIYDIISLVLISSFIPLIIFIGLKRFNISNYNKVSSILAIIFFTLEALRFFVQASFYELGRIPTDDLKFCVVTFMSIFSLFANYIQGKIRPIFRKLFILLSVTVLIQGIFKSRLYSLDLDQYSIIKGLYFIESAITISLSVSFIKEEKYEFKFTDLLIAIGFCLVSFGVSLFYISYWKLSIEKDILYYIGMITLALSVIPMYFIFKSIKINE